MTFDVKSCEGLCQSYKVAHINIEKEDTKNINKTLKRALLLFHISFKLILIELGL